MAQKKVSQKEVAMPTVVPDRIKAVAHLALDLFVFCQLKLDKQM